MKKTALLLTVAAALGLGLSACEERDEPIEENVEDAADDIEDGAEEFGDDVEDAADEVDPD